MSNITPPSFLDPVTASLWLKDGKLLAYPTESVWGIGCDAFNENAVRQILAIKNRPIEKGMIVVTDSMARLDKLLTKLTDEQRQTLANSWGDSGVDSWIDSGVNSRTQNQTEAQATTWLLPIPADVSIPNWITGTHDSLAVRVIAHPLIQQLCEAMVSDTNPFGFIISTSCNPATYSPATNYDEAYAYFSDEIGYLLGDTLGYTKPSQIKDVLTGQVLR